MSVFKNTNLTEKALQLFKTLPKISEYNVKLNPKDKVKKKHVGKRGDHGHKPRGAMQQLAYKYLGYEGGHTPYYKRIPIENSYNFGHHVRREYPTLSLYELQLLIDTGRIEKSHPIDLMKILATKILKFDQNNYYGINLIDRGMDIFLAKVNIEVQWASEPVIAAIERAGGTITTAYYDPISISILKDPLTFFTKGEPIPRRLYPPQDLVDYYTNPANRGYLVKDKITLLKAREELAQKYGYEIPQTKQVQTSERGLNQIFFGLKPGSLISTKDRTVLQPTDPVWKEYYEGSYTN